MAPPEVPDGITDEVDFFGNEDGVDRRLPFGVLHEIVGGLPKAQPTPAPIQPVRPGGDIQEPRKIKNVLPVYPELAKKARVQGTVILETIIDPQGNVTNVRVLRSIALLDQAAINAVKQWKYEPTLLNGVPVPIVMTVKVRFQLH